MFIEPRFRDKYSLNPEMVRQGRKCNNRKSNNQDINLDKSYHVIENHPPPSIATKKAANPRKKNPLRRSYAKQEVAAPTGC